MHPKLTWVTSLGNSLSFVLTTSVHVLIQDTVDPLMKLIIVELGEDLGKSDFNPLQTIIHAFAKSNDCVIKKIKKEPKRLVIEILTKVRLGKTMDKNPLI